jgi:hypothetical protein
MPTSNSRMQQLHAQEMLTRALAVFGRNDGSHDGINRHVPLIQSRFCLHEAAGVAAGPAAGCAGALCQMWGMAWMHVCACMSL